MAFVYCLVGVLFLYALYKERQALGCRTIPNGVDCDNANGKVVRGTSPKQDDSTGTLLNKLELISKTHEEFVTWRVSFMLSIAIVLLIFFVCFNRVPTEIELVQSIFICFSTIYFSFNFYCFHVWKYIGKNTNDISKILRSRE